MLKNVNLPNEIIRESVSTMDVDDNLTKDMVEQVCHVVLHSRIEYITSISILCLNIWICIWSCFNLVRLLWFLKNSNWIPYFFNFQMLKFVPTLDEANLFNTHANEAHQFAAGDSYLYEMSKLVCYHCQIVKTVSFWLLSFILRTYVHTWHCHRACVLAWWGILALHYICFLYLSFRVPHFEQRLKALYYQKGFSERIGEIKPKLECELTFQSGLFFLNLFVFLRFSICNFRDQSTSFGVYCYGWKMNFV